MPLTAVFVVSSVLSAAAVTKLRGPLSFSAVLRQLFPVRLARFLARAMPMTELAVAVGLIAGRFPAVAALGAITLLVGFEFVLLIMWRRGATMDCGCFGESREAAGPRTGLIRNLGLIALATAIVAVPERATVWDTSLGDALAAGTVAGAVIALWLTVSTLTVKRELLLSNWRSR
jgi:hypothetical protein